MALTIPELQEMAALAQSVGDEEAEMEALEDLEQLGAFDTTLKQKAARILFNPAAEDLPELPFRLGSVRPLE